MSIKTYNKDTGKWEVRGSATAMNTAVLDTLDNYASDNVEGCLREISNKFTDVEADIAWLKEHGGGGSGGGGGGGGTSYGPTLTLESEAEASIATGTDFYVYFYYKSPNKGRGTLYVRQNFMTIATVEGIDQGAGYYVFKNLEKGEHNLSLSIMDPIGELTDSINVVVTVGGLELKSRYDDSQDLTLQDIVKIPYTIDTISKAPIYVTFTLDGEVHTEEMQKGDHIWEIGKLSTMGVHQATIYAESGELSSNTLVFNLVLSDAETLYVSTTYQESRIEVGKNLQLDYRNSMLGQTRFYTDMYIDGVLTDTVTSYPGYNFWNVGDSLTIGQHTLQLISYTYPDRDIQSNTIEWNIEVVAVDYVPWQIVTDGLICNFDANGKQQDSLTRDTWTDTSGNNIKCKLHNFNYSTNGWIDNALRFTGRCYAEIDYAPFADGCPNGLTFDIFFKVKDVGDIDAKVLYCKNNITPYQGIYINTHKSNHRSAQSKITECSFQDDTWTRVTYVIDRDNNHMIQYINAVITRPIYISPSEKYDFNGKIILGASLDELDNNLDANGKPIPHFANCDIKYVRIYNRALSDEEILQNHIADIKNREEQLAKRELNFGDSTIPMMVIQGNLDTMSNVVEATVMIDYEDPLDVSKRFRKEGCLISWQGTSSLEYPVKNYTIKLRDGGNDWLYAPKDNWIPESRYTLKANFMDSSQANNVGTARFAHDMMTESGVLYPSQIKNPKCRGSIDGFPIRLVMNGEFMGIYMFNIDRYATRNWGLEGEDLAISYEIAVNSTGGAGAFADDSWASVRNEFEHRYHYAGEEDVVCEQILMNGVNTTVLKAGYHNDLVDLVSWVKNSTIEEFGSQINEHFSLPHLIDYYLIVYSLGLVDNFGKNMVITTWGPDTEGNVVWYPSLYDCDSMMGLTNDGELRYSSGIDPADGDYNTSDSVLWTKLKTAFSKQIADRYFFLRANNYLTYEKLLKYYDADVAGTIGESFYNQDQRIKYLNEANRTHVNKCNGSRLEHTRRWLSERLAYMDSVYEYGDWQKSATIRVNGMSGNVSIQLKSYSPMMVTVSFSDQAQGSVKAKIDKDKLYTLSGPVGSDQDNNIFIKGITNISHIEGLEALNVSSMQLENATKLTGINVAGSKRIQQLRLDNCVMLQTLNAKNCTNLGIDDNYKSINLVNCVNLKYLDLSGSQIGEVQLNENGGSLEYLNLSNSNLTNLVCHKQEYLPEIIINNCADLATLSVRGCNALTRLEVTHSRLNSISIVECDKLEYLDVSYTGQLANPVVDGLVGLKTLKLAGLSNSGFKVLDCRNVPNLEYLDVSKCDFLTTVRWANGFKKLKTLICSNSTIKNFRFGNNEAPNYLDLSPFTLNNVSFYNCTGVEEIRGINLVATGSMSPFTNCLNLHTIQGKVKLKGSIYQGFMDCQKLVNFPTLDLSEVTSISECFMNCKKMTWDQMRSILNKLTSCTDFYHGFSNCTGITCTSYPADLFAKCTKMTSLYWTFRGCTGMTGQLGVGIFDKLTNLETVRAPFPKITGYVPPNLFRYNTKLKSCLDLFAGMTELTSGMNETTFKTCTKLHTIEGLFNGATNATMVISDQWFKNCPIADADFAFQNCKNLVGTIPENFFTNKTSLSTCHSLFNGCTGLTGSIPDYFFANMPNLRDVHGAFQSCIGLTGQIPKNFWINSNGITRCDYLFSGCTKLGGDPTVPQEIPVDLFANKGAISNVSYMFNGCKFRFQIPDYFFKDCYALTTISGLFQDCQGAYGQIPEHLFTVIDAEGNEVATPITEARAVFNGCIYLSGEIPGNLFDRFLSVVDLSDFFRNCRNLKGKVPDNLFKRCYSLIKATSMFHDASSLGRYTVEDFSETTGDPYFISPEIFSSCANLTDVSYMFYGWGYGSSQRGWIPPELFRYSPRLQNASYLFCNCTNLSGGLDSQLFRYNPLLTNLNYCFQSCTGLNGELSSSFLSAQYQPKLTGLSSTFDNCSKLTGTAPKLWEEFPAAERVDCFNGCIKLDNYNEIPAGWL